MLFSLKTSEVQGSHYRMKEQKPYTMDTQQEETVVVTSAAISEERNSEALLSSIDLSRRLSHSSTISTGARSGYESALSSPRSPNPIFFRIPELVSSMSRRSSVLLGVPDLSILVTSSTASVLQTPPTATNQHWALQSPSLLLPTQLIANEMPTRSTPASLLTLSGRYRCPYCELSSEDRFLIHLHMIQLHADFVNVPLDALLGVPLSALSTGINQQPFLPPVQTSQSAEVLRWLPQTIAGASASSSSSLSELRIPTSLHHGVAESSTGAASTPTPEGQVRCETCGKFLPKKKPLSSLLNHAKRHYLLKQFICIQCPYGSSEAAHVRNHMKLRHNVVDSDPLDVRSASLQEAWLKITSRCFPTMTAELTRFRFKRFRKRHRKRTGSEAGCSSQLSSTGQDRSSNDSSDSSSQPGTSTDAKSTGPTS